MYKIKILETIIFLTVILLGNVLLPGCDEDCPDQSGTSRCLSLSDADVADVGEETDVEGENGEESESEVVICESHADCRHLALDRYSTSACFSGICTRVQCEKCQGSCDQNTAFVPLRYLDDEESVCGYTCEYTEVECGDGYRCQVRPTPGPFSMVAQCIEIS
jgi:hypothetical protein